MDYVLLADEIATDPTNAGYSTMSDAEIAASLSEATIRIRQRVSIERLQAITIKTGVYTALRVAVATPETPAQLVALCQTTLDLANAKFPDIDLDNPSAIQMFGALRQYGIISAQQAAAIDALATARVVSRAEQIGLGEVVSADDIERSRIVPALDALRVRLANGYNAAVEALDAAATVPEWREIVAVIEAA
ncbi:MAG: hypothetical protein IPK44_01160 [Candidatus Accumulibacter sp.]|uniref:hypothetical protein n=1 Tax=Accumulibacter sp. TaxID=2053492 RepID=UPI0025864397|nr:hypothetical protein [Accumulibacter sp.]MBK8113207.1 hypothetical protein [Accumulibacter sp.]